MALAIAALAVTVLIGIIRGAASPVEHFDTDAVPTASAVAAADLYVHVSGAVAQPGLYVLRAGSRAVDAVAAAGGFAADADEAAINLARPLDDGEQLVIPVIGAAPAAVGVAGDGLIDLNTADAALLDTLPRVGPAMAERIIAWRDENGRFTSVDDLLAVPGIGDKMLAAIRDAVRV